MKYKKLIYWVFGFLLFASWTDLVWGQDIKPKVEVINDGNFKKKIAKGLVVVVFTSKWQEKNVDNALLKGVEGYQKAVVITVASEDTKKVVKKLRLRNFPSLALFYNGSKKEVWKADMDGNLELTDKYIKAAFDEVLAGDVF